MKQERILYALGNVADAYICEAAPIETPKATTGRVAKIFAAALVAIAIAAIAFVAIRGVKTNAPEEMTQEETPETTEYETTDASMGDERFVEIKELLRAVGNGEGVEMAARTAQIPVGQYTATYEGVEGVDLDALQSAIGKVYPEADGWYYLSGHTDRQFLIETRAEETVLWKFVCFNEAPYAYGDVLTEIYGVRSADGFERVVVSAGTMDNTPEGKRLQQEIGTHTVTDRAALTSLYRILSGSICHGQDRWDEIQTGAQDANEVGDTPDDHLEMRTTRYLTIVTPYNEIDTLKYTAASGMFYEWNGVAYEALSKEDAETMRDILGIEAPETMKESAGEGETQTTVSTTEGAPDQARAPEQEDAMSTTISSNYQQFYAGAEQIKSAGSAPNQKETLVRYEFQTTDDEGNPVRDKMSKEETMKTVNEIAAQYDDSVIVQFSGDGLAKLIDHKMMMDMPVEEREIPDWMITHLEGPEPLTEEQLAMMNETHGDDTLAQMRAIDPEAYAEFERVDAEGKAKGTPEGMAAGMRYVINWIRERAEKDPDWTERANEKIKEQEKEEARETNAELSANAIRYLQTLQEQFRGYQFFIVGSADEKNRLSAQGMKELSAIFMIEELERMAQDETYAAEMLKQHGLRND